MALDKYDDFKPELSERFDYKNPSEFEDVDGIDISMTDMRKAIKIQIGEESIELDKEQAGQIMLALDHAMRIM